jgi:branched-chain amino acid transport system ATP-binding protein
MLRLNAVRAGYGDSIVLRDVSVVVPDSAVVALIGANGAGKTTLLRVASGLLKPRSGRVLMDGQDLTFSRPYELVGHGIHHIPEGRGIFPGLSVRDNLVVYSEKGREAEAQERAVEAFPRLAGKLAQLAGTLSGGEQQMLALTRAYVRSPRVVLLDEISMGLAPQLVEEVLAFLQRLVAGGSSLLMVEQYVTKALAIADYVYVLNRGRLAFAGEPAELNGDDVFARYLGVDLSSG